MIGKRKNHAVSEIVGTVLLLGIAIAMFTLVQLFAFGLLNENPNSPSVRLVASVENGNVTIFHNGGDSLPLNTKILVTINDDSSTTREVKIDGNLTDGGSGSSTLWDIGEKVNFNLSDLGLDYSFGDSVSVIVIDVESNSVIMSATIKEQEK